MKTKKYLISITICFATACLLLGNSSCHPKYTDTTYTDSTFVDSNAYEGTENEDNYTQDESRQETDDDKQEETSEEDENLDWGKIVYKGDYDHCILKNKNGCAIVHINFGSLDEGDIIGGDFTVSYNQDVKIYRSCSTASIDIPSDQLSDEEALEWLGERRYLNQEDQNAYDHKDDVPKEQEEAE